MPEKPYGKSKIMPSPAVPAKKVKPQVYRVESEASKAENWSLNDQKEYNTRIYTSLSSPGGIVGPARKKGPFEVPKHSERVESAFKQYEEDRAEQEQEEEEEGGGGGGGQGEEEEDTREYSGLGASFEGLPRNRDSEAKRPYTVEPVLGFERAIDFGNRFDAKSTRSRPKETPAKMPELQSSRPTGFGGQLGARVESDRPKKTPARISEFQSSWDSGTGGQPGVKVTSDRPKETSAKMPELQSSRHTGFGGQLGARVKSRRPGLSKAAERNGQLDAKVTSNRPKKTLARRPKLQSSPSKVHSESVLMGAKGPVAGQRDTPQAPPGFRVAMDEANNVEYLEELDSGDDK